MSQESDNQGTGGYERDEVVGSVGEEAAKLFAAFSDAAREHLTGNEPQPGPGPMADSMPGSITESLHNIKAHLATGGEDCRYCPVCQLIHVVRQTSPEVKTHMTTAATALLQAAAAVLATHVPPANPAAPMEKINLDDESEWERDS